MLPAFPSPILSVAADVVKDLEGEDAVYGLWCLFTKCKESIKDGRRLENLSWRLWYREMAAAQPSPVSSPGSLSPSWSSEHRSPSPITPVSEDGRHGDHEHSHLPPLTSLAASSWHGADSTPAVLNARRLSSASVPMDRRTSHVGKVILDILPVNDMPPRSPRTADVTARPSPKLAQPRPTVAIPTVQLPATPPQQGGALFPRVVVVNPTPHPTPPATPNNAHPPASGLTQSSTYLHPPPARSLLTAQLATHMAPRPSVSPRVTPVAPVARALSPPEDAKRKMDDTIKASDRRFFLKEVGSPSPERPPSSNKSDPGEASPSSTSSHVKSEVNGPTATAAAKRPRATQGRKSKDRHPPARPALNRLHSHGKVATRKTVAHVAPAAEKKAAFNIGSVSSNGSRGAPPPKAPAKAAAAGKTKSVSPRRKAAPEAPRANGGSALSSSDFETTDSDSDSEWASEDGSASDRDRTQKAQAAQAKVDQEERERRMFAKVPRVSYTDLKRTESGLLSQLLNPDPALFPPNHPYRRGFSSQDVAQLRRPAQNGASGLHTSKSAAAVPLAAQVTAQAPQGNYAEASVRREASAGGSNSRERAAYRPRGPPQGEELDSSSESENPDNTIQVSASIAQQKLAALMDPSRRRNSDKGQQAQRAHLQQQLQQHGAQQQVARVQTAPIPLSHPYNLPAPAPPMTPRTTRRQMLASELSESLRRNLLWERQVSRMNMTGGARRTGGMQPPPAPEEDAEEKRRARMRSLVDADDYHYAGW